LDVVVAAMGATSKWRKTLASFKRSSKSSPNEKDSGEVKEEKDAEKTPKGRAEKEEVAPTRNILYRLSTFKSSPLDKDETVSSQCPLMQVTVVYKIYGSYMPWRS
jgi:hypothetical protein